MQIYEFTAWLYYLVADRIFALLIFDFRPEVLAFVFLRGSYDELTTVETSITAISDFGAFGLSAALAESRWI